MTAPFSDRYAGAYDDLYKAKDYAAECDMVLAEARGPVGRVLDLGCGTGGHALVLAERGMDVTGIDRSEPMLAIARRKAAESKVAARLHFTTGDVQKLDLGGQAPFDLVMMMFAVIGYQHSNAEIAATLAGVKRMLAPGATFVFDCWFGPAVLSERPSERVKVIEREDGRLIRVARGELDVMKHLCTVSYQLWSLPNEAPAEFAEEAHVMRYFFPQELALLLEQAGLQLTRIVDFDAPDQAPTQASWNVLCVAKSA